LIPPFNRVRKRGDDENRNSTMDDLRKRILLDLVITPSTVIPVLLGGSFLLLSEMLGGYSAFFGFVGLLVGFGAFLTNLVFNLESISKRAVKQWQEQQTKAREKELDSLDRRLAKTEGDRDENALRNLRTLYKSFSSDVAGGKLSDHVPPQMLQSIDEIFQTCVAKLDRSYEIYRTAATMTGKLKRDMEEQRQALVSEVETSVHELANVINEVRALKFRNEGDDLRLLQNRLSSQLEIAKATEDGMASVMRGDRAIYDTLKEYE
jgi:hypothetical protein